MFDAKKTKHLHKLVRNSTRLITSVAFVFIHHSTTTLDAQQDQEIRGFDVAPRNIVLNTQDGPRGRSNLITNTTWGEIVVTAQALPEDLDPRIDYIPELTVKIHWLSPEPDQNDLDFKERQVFSLEQTYYNLKPARQMAFVAYIPPDWLQRFGGAAKFRTGSNIAVEIVYKGKTVVQTELRERGSRAGNDPDWFKGDSKKGVLKPIQQTPWMMENWDRYYRPEKWSQL
jgi:hypothetical protein